MVILGVGKGVLFREVSSSFQGCPHRGIRFIDRAFESTSLRVINLSLSFSPPSSLHSTCPRHLGVRHSLCYSHHCPVDFRLSPATQVPQKQVSIDDCHSKPETGPCESVASSAKEFISTASVQSNMKQGGGPFLDELEFRYVRLLEHDIILRNNNNYGCRLSYYYYVRLYHALLTLYCVLCAWGRWLWVLSLLSFIASMLNMFFHVH